MPPLRDRGRALWRPRPVNRCRYQGETTKVTEWLLQGLNQRAYDVDNKTAGCRFEKKSIPRHLPRLSFHSPSGGEIRMTKKQMLLTSLLAAIPALGLVAALALAAIGGTAGSGMLWGLFGATLLLSIGALASPVVVFLLIPEGGVAATVSPDEASPEAATPTDSEVDAEELEEADVADDLGDFDDDDDFQVGDDADEEFDDFDDDEDFV